MCLWHPLPYSFGSSHSQVIVWTVVVKPTHKNSAPAPGCEWSHLLVESILQLVNHFGMNRGTVDYVELPDNLYHFLPLPNRVPSLQQKPTLTKHLLGQIPFATYILCQIQSQWIWQKPSRTQPLDTRKATLVRSVAECSLVLSWEGSSSGGHWTWNQEWKPADNPVLPYTWATRAPARALSWSFPRWAPQVDRDIY